MNIISADKLTKQYGDFKAVNGISFTVEKGELLGFLGVNGAGKSTTINMLSTLIPLTSGSAEICGFDVMKNAPADTQAHRHCISAETALTICSP